MSVTELLSSSTGWIPPFSASPPRIRLSSIQNVSKYYLISIFSETTDTLNKCDWNAKMQFLKKFGIKMQMSCHEEAEEGSAPQVHYTALQHSLGLEVGDLAAVHLATQKLHY